MKRSRIGVTGANGYVGSTICAALADPGHELIAFQSKNSNALAPSSVSQVRHYTLTGRPQPSALRDLDAIIHCAWDLRLTRPRDIWRVNVAGTRHLFGAAAVAGVRRKLFISSMSAYDGTRQVYGRAKLDCERFVAEFGGVSLRLGLVYGPGRGGMVGLLRKLAILPFFPMIGSRSHQFTLHEDDLSAAMVRILATHVPLPNPLGLAHQAPVPFGLLMRDLATSQNKAFRPIPIPWQLVFYGLIAAERLRLPIKVRADSVLGLIRPAPFVPGHEQLGSLGITLRRFSAHESS